MTDLCVAKPIHRWIFPVFAEKKSLWIKRRRETVDWQFTHKLGFVTHILMKCEILKRKIKRIHTQTNTYTNTIMRPFGNGTNILEYTRVKKRKNDWLSSLRMKFKASTYWFIGIMIKWMSSFFFNTPNTCLLHKYFMSHLIQRWKSDVWYN